MFAYELSVGPVDLAFTDRIGGVSAAPFDGLNLAVGSADPAVPRNVELVREAFGAEDRWVHLRQVHGRSVYRAGADFVEEAERPEADGVVTVVPELTLSVRAADCVPILLADPAAGVIGAVHAGRAGMVSGVAIEAVGQMHALGARNLQAWIGPYVCGACYEVPPDMHRDVVAVVPESEARTSWGTPALDLGAGVRAQLEGQGVAVYDVSLCTRELSHLYSYRRDGARAGRHVGIIRIRA